MADPKVSKYHSKVFNAYEILPGIIGRGGFGVVVAATEKPPGKNNFRKKLQKQGERELEKAIHEELELGFEGEIDRAEQMIRLRNMEFSSSKRILIFKRIYKPIRIPANSDLFAQDDCTRVSEKRKEYKRLAFAQVGEMDKEINMIKEMRTFSHPNLVTLVSAILETPPEGKTWFEKHDPYWRHWIKDQKPPSSSDDSGDNVDTGEMCVMTIVQSFCNMGSLGDWLYQDDSSNNRNSCWMLTPHISDALRFLHSKGIFHRDLKPDNILITSASPGSGGVEIKPGEYAVLKIGDFGLTKILPMENLPTSSQVENPFPEMTIGVGTNLYKSPELAAGEPYDSSVDIYAFAMILLEMFIKFASREARVAPLTSLKWEKELTLEVVNRKIPKNATSFVDSSLVTLIGKMMSKNPLERPSAASVHSSLILFASSRVPLPIIDIPSDRIESPFAITRSEKALLLNHYDNGDENIIFLSGSAGSGKTDLCLQFAQTLANRSEPPSIFYIHAVYNRNFKCELLSIGNRLRLDMYQSNCHPKSTLEILSHIFSHFSEHSKRLVLIVDGCETNRSSPEKYVAIISFWKLVRTMKNPPFVLVTTRENGYHSKLQAHRDYYAETAPLTTDGIRTKYKSMIANLWENTEGLEPPLEISLESGFSAGEAEEFLTRRLGTEFMTSVDKESISELLDTLKNKPFRLELCAGVISTRRKHLHYKDYSIWSYLQEFQSAQLIIGGGGADKIPGFDPQDSHYHYSSDFLDRLVMNMTLNTMNEFPDKLVEKIEWINKSSMEGSADNATLHKDADADDELAKVVLRDLGVLKEVGNVYPWNHIFSLHLPDTMGIVLRSSNENVDEEFENLKKEQYAEANVNNCLECSSSYSFAY